MGDGVMGAPVFTHSGRARLHARDNEKQKIRLERPIPGLKVK